MLKTWEQGLCHIKDEFLPVLRKKAESKLLLKLVYFLYTLPPDFLILLHSDRRPSPNVPLEQP